MKSKQRPFLYLTLLAASSLLLPACGGQGNVKSKKAPETVLADSNPEISSDENPSHSGDSYVSTLKNRKTGTASAEAPSMPASTEGTTAQEAPSTSQTPAMETAAPVKSGSSWLWWVLGLLVVLAGAYLVWKKRHAEGSTSQPMPPVGGLSPVSGFTAVKDRIEEEAEEAPSFWSKKLF